MMALQTGTTHKPQQQLVSVFKTISAQTASTCHVVVRDDEVDGHAGRRQLAVARGAVGGEALGGALGQEGLVKLFQSIIQSINI